jgi:CysZ protein
MIQSFSAAFLQLKDPKILKLVILSIICTVLVYAGLFAGLGWFLRSTVVAELSWLDSLLDAGAGVAAGVLAWFLFPGVVTGIVGVFLDDVARAVEARHYPHVGLARHTPMLAVLGSSARLIATTVGLNLVLLPIYVLLVFFPPLNLVLFYMVNGRLLGREYFETVALRHHDTRTVTGLLRQHRWQIWGAGAITAAMLTVPGLNLVAPVIGTAAMVHLFHKLTGRA